MIQNNKSAKVGACTDTVYVIMAMNIPSDIATSCLKFRAFWPTLLF